MLGMTEPRAGKEGVVEHLVHHVVHLLEGVRSKAVLGAEGIKVEEATRGEHYSD